MRILSYLLLGASLQLSASTFGQKVNLNVKNGTLERVFKELRKQSGYSFIYNASYLNQSTPITVRIKNEEILVVLENILQDQPFDYVVNGKVVSLVPQTKKKVHNTKDAISNLQQPISGFVRDQSGNPLIKATIQVKGKDVYTPTDEQGYFVLENVGPEETLIVTFMGYESIEIGASANLQNIVLKPSRMAVDEVVIVGYGTQSKRLVTSAISKIDGNELESKAINTIGEGLKGKVAGVRIYSSDNQPGAEPTFVVRGGSSINNGNSPLVLVDGVQRDMSGISPNDIETIQVLKDAASTAIYGARGSNGVVMITTKSGKYGEKTNMRFEASGAHQTPAMRFDLMNGEDFIYTMRNAVAVGTTPNSNYGSTAAGTGNGESSIFSTRYLADGETVPAGYKSMVDPLNPNKTIIYQDNDVQDRLFRPTWWQNYYLQANGGSERASYNFSAGYTEDDGIGKSTSYGRFTVHGNTKFKINDFITLDGGFDFSEMDLVDLPSNKRTYLQRTLAIPNTQKVYWPDGTPVHGTNSTTIAPDWYAYYFSRDRKVKRFTVSAALNFQLTKDWKATVKGSNFDRYNRFDGFQKETNYANARSATADISHLIRRNVQAYTNYQKHFGSHHTIDGMLGTEVYYNIINSLGANASGGASDYIPTLTAQPLKEGATSGKTRESLLSYFSRVNYSLKNKYLLSVSMRTDASSKFAKENRWGYFPSASAGWILSDEDFIKNIDNISFLKLRTSFGQTGNNDIGLFDAVGSYNVAGKYDGNSAMFSDVMGNRSLAWETTTQFDVGLELAMFNNRVSVDLDWFNKVTDNLILNMTLPNTTGFGSVQINSGSVQFYGFDAHVHTKNIVKNNFSWTSDFTYSYVKNKVLSLPDNGLSQNRMNGVAVGDGTFFGGYAEGEQLGAIIGYKVKGIIETQEQANNAYYDTGSRGFRFEDGLSVAGRKTIGDYEYVNREGSSLRADGSIQINAEDQFILGYTRPHSTGGINNTFSYKDLSLSVHMDYQIGSSMVNTLYQRFFMGTFGYSYNLHEDVKKAWKNPGDDTKYARFFANDPDAGNGNYTRTSDIFTQNSNYLCLRDVTLSYSLKGETLRLNNLKNINLYISASNIYYFTQVEGVSPEYSVTSTYDTDYSPYPTTRRISFGVKANF